MLQLATGAGFLPGARAVENELLKLCPRVGNATSDELRFIQQLGVKWVEMKGPGAPGYAPDGRIMLMGRDRERPPGPWTEAEILPVKKRIEAAGLKLGNMMMHDFRDVILGRAGRDRDIEHVMASLRLAGRLEIPVVEYNFYATRAMGGYYREEGRGGAQYLAHDYSRGKDLPPLDAVGEHSAEALWSRLEYFLKAVIPVAEEAGVRMSVHPNDPPAPQFRGAVQILGSMRGLKRLLDIVPRPASGVTFDTGVTREMGYDIDDTIRFFHRRDQINHVDFRNVWMKEPRLRYTEVFIDEGDVDML
ncbi:MAG: TIM barrel protein, partial [bacterium]|nr:TIM barrel protein [bacterium]